jgi:hypothetical protein
MLTPEVAMSEVLGSILSAVKPRPQLAKPEADSVSRFELDEAKFLAETMKERRPSPGGSANPA